MSKKVLVIGAGIAGLSAASYLQRNGFSTEIFELHDQPGGLCTAWTRKGYRFDGCIHWLMGSSPASNMHQLWKELGAGDLTYTEWDVHTVLRLRSGDSFTVYTNPERLKAEMLRLGPEDGRVISVITRNIRRVSRADMPAALDKLSPSEALRLLAGLPGLAPIFLKWMRYPVARFVEEFKSPKLKEAFTELFGAAGGEFPAAGLFMMLGFMAKQSSGYPEGGSLAFSKAIEKRYLDLGGLIHYRSRVSEIILENGVAVGLRGEFGELRGDYVVSAGDAHNLMEDLLGGKHRVPEFDKAFSSFPRYPSLLFVGIGFKNDYSHIPHSYSFPLKSPLVLEGGALRLERLGIRLFHFDPTTAPLGKTAGVVMIETGNDELWTSLRSRDPEGYKEAKARVAEAVLEALDGEFPGMAAAAEVIDVATPATFLRYTNNWHGSYEGWLPLIGYLGTSLPRTVPGVANLHLVGQWVNPGGGLPPAAMDGRKLARKLCRKEGRHFRPD